MVLIMKNPPTDLKILRLIYKVYYDSYKAFTRENKNRKVKVYVPIDLDLLASKLKTDKDIIFGRLYYHLENKYGYKNDDGSHVAFFTRIDGEDKDCIQFPYMASVLANLEEERSKFSITLWIALISIIISFISLLFSLLN